MSVELIDNSRTLRDLEGRVYGPRVGMEGPLIWRGRRVVYWDRIEGKYYDPSTDLYLSIKQVETP